LFSQLKQCVSLLNPDSTQLVDELQKSAGQDTNALLIEYARLFIGPFKLPTPPYASCYLGSKELNNEITEWVRKFYESSGLEFDYTIMDLPDHIAVETEFLHYLLTQQLIAANENEPEALAENETRYHTFLEKHHGCWVPVLSQNVITESSEPFYQNLFRLIKEMLPSL
jgi:putative dimethyl sulfoxide reductase chaperone